MEMSSPYMNKQTINVTYVINNELVFSPANNTFSDMHNDTQLVIFATAARCFLHLIENQGKIISQSELMHVGWEMHGMTVTPNAYYQNISNIRRAISEFLGNAEIITTVKRSGLIVQDSVTIEKLLTPVEESSPAVGQDEVSLTEESHLTANATVAEKPTVMARKKLGRADILKSAALLLILAIVPVLTYLMTKTPEQNFIERYHFVAKAADGCDVYMNRDSGNKIDDNKQINLKTLNCRGFTKVYVTQWDKHHRFSVFFCDPNNTLYCISDYYGVES